MEIIIDLVIGLVCFSVRLLSKTSGRCWCHVTFHQLTQLPLDKMAAILADDIFKCIFLNENDRIPIQISLKFVPDDIIDYNTALV